MLEMFILNPPVSGKGKRRTRRLSLRKGRRSRRRMRLARNPKNGRFLKNGSKKRTRISRRKTMAVRTRRRKAAGRRRYRRNSWFRQSRDHAVAAKLGWAYQTRRRKKGGKPRRYILKGIKPGGGIGKRRLLRYRAVHKVARRRKSARRLINFRIPMFGRRYKLVANKRRRRSSRRRKYMDNARRTRRRSARGAGGRFVSKSKGSRRRYRKNWFV